jgi:hypothetical protein
MLSDRMTRFLSTNLYGKATAQDIGILVSHNNKAILEPANFIGNNLTYIS